MKHILYVSFFIFLLTSCTKEVTPLSNTSTPPAIESFQQFSVTSARLGERNKLLKREISYTAANPLLKNVKMFSYDASNRCIEIKIGTIDSSKTDPSFVLSQTLSFNYDSPTSLLPYSLSSVKTVFPHLSTIFYFKYNSDNMKVLDSVRVKNQLGQPADRTVHYTYEKGKVYATPVFSGFSLENSSLDTLEIKGGNIQKLVSRRLKSTGDLSINYSFTYDQFISPYSKLNIANSLYFESSAIGLGYNVPLETHYVGVTTNNMTSWTSGSAKASFTYLYDQDNYPIRKEGSLPGATPLQIVLFEY